MNKDSKTITIRLYNEEIAELKKRAGGESVGVYIVKQIRKSLGGKVSDSIEKVLPIYDWHIHKGGEKVRELVGREWIEIIAPEIDGDGRPINWEG